MGKLDGAVCYLSGPMEFAEDFGVGWRQKIIKSFKDNNLNIVSIDPTNKPSSLDNTLEEDIAITRKLKNEGKWEELEKLQDQLEGGREA